MKSTPKLCLLLATVAFLVAPPDPAQGQAIQSTLLGTVTDATGAVVTGATATVKNEGTNCERTMITDESGHYRSAGLQVGSDQARVSAHGSRPVAPRKIAVD